MLPLAIGLLSAIALIALGVWIYRRYFRKSSGREDRYAPQQLLTAEQVSMLDYLHDTFPGQEVLTSVRLSQMLGIRRAQDQRRAAQRLDGHLVDYVVCGKDGRPVFAFDVEQYHLSDAKARAHKLKMKNRMLKTAGVRFVFLKNGIHRMPSPNEFRRQLDLAELPRPTASNEPERESVRQQLESKFSEFDQLYPATGFRDSDVMGLSGLMDLGTGGTRAPAAPSVQPGAAPHKLRASAVRNHAGTGRPLPTLQDRA